MSKYQSYTTYASLWNKSFPSHWSVLPMYALAKEKSICGCVDLPLLSVYLDVGVIPFSAKAEKRTNVTSKDLSKYQRVDCGDFVLNNQQAWRGSVGISFDTGIVSPAYIVLSMNDMLNSRYANYLLRSQIMVDQYLINSKSVGSIQRNIYWPALKRTSVPVPSREEQDQIVRFLDWKVSNINKLINIKKNMIALLENRKKSIINGVLAGGASNAVCKESVIEGLLTIPTTWDERPLKFYASSNDESLSSKTPSNYKFNYIDISTTGFRKLKKEPVFTTFEEAPSRARRIVREGDTILSTVRTYLKAILYIDNTKDGNVVSTGFAVLRPKDGVYPPLLSYALSCDYFINAVIRNSVGVSYPAINDKKLLSLKLALPKSYDEQVKVYEQIMALTESTDITIKYLQDMVNGLQDLKNRLVADTVTGKIDVRSIEIPEYEFVDEDIDNADEIMEQGVNEPLEEE